MERLTRTMAGCGLTLALAVAGCKSTHSEVPPGRPYSADGRQAPPVGFSADPHPITSPGIAGAPGSPQYGVPGAANSGNFGAPTNNAFGPPGTAPVGGMGTSPGIGVGSGNEATAMPMGGLGAPSVGGAAPGFEPSAAPGQMPAPQ
jgi:hypothetical protein